MRPQALLAAPAVEDWCAPYVEARRPCAEMCGNGATYAALPGSVRTVGGAGPDGVLQMQLELLRGGPGAVSFLVTADFFGYAGGVYVVPPNATVVGGHAVALLGWGIDPAGVPYWICQNSWGKAFGEGGFFRHACTARPSV